MTPEEFLEFLNKSQEEDKYYKESYEAFSKKLSFELEELVYMHLPEANEKRIEIQDKIKKIAGKYTKEVWEGYNYACSCDLAKDPVKKERSVPKPETRKDSEKKLLEELENIPWEQHELYRKNHWELYEEQKQHEDFLFATHGKMKEILVEIYEEEIQELESDYMRLLDNVIYLMCANQFLQAIYELVENDL